jgi:hypothetical protein
MVFVATGLSTPDLWPYAFGKWGDAYTIRRFWGYGIFFLCSDIEVLIDSLHSRTWHQFMRRVSLAFRHIYSIANITLSALLISREIYCPPGLPPHSG